MSYNVKTFEYKENESSTVKYREVMTPLEGAVSAIPDMTNSIVTIAESVNTLVSDNYTSYEWYDDACRIIEMSNDLAQELKDSSINIVKDVNELMESIKGSDRRVRLSIESRQRELGDILSNLEGINSKKVGSPNKPAEPTPTEETPKEEEVPKEEETPVEETPTEETPTEETPTEETPVEETPVEEPAPVEAPVEEPAPVETPTNQGGSGIPMMDENGYIVRQQSQAAQDVINKLYHDIDTTKPASVGAIRAQGRHSAELDSMIDNLSPEECAWVMSRIENDVYGQSDRHGHATPETDQHFIDNQLYERFDGDIHNLLKSWGTYSYGGY